MALDIARAIRRNSHWSRQLGWDRHYERILTLFHSVPQNPTQFAEAVAQWQGSRRPRIDVDGIIGPTTWGIMRTDLGISSAPSSGPDASLSEYVEVRGVPILVAGMDQEHNGRPPAVAAHFSSQRAHIVDALNRIPRAHLVAIPSIIIGDRPSSGGAFSRPPLIRLNRRTFSASHNRAFLFTLLHEIGHAVDNHFRIVSAFTRRTGRRGRDWAAFRAIEYRGRNKFPPGHPEAGTPRYGEHFAEGYAHLLTRPWKLTSTQRTLIQRLARV